MRVSHGTLYGEEVSSEPRLVPSRVNWMPAMPDVMRLETVGSEAEAEREMLADTVALESGEDRETVGLVVSGRGLETVIVMGLDVVMFPARSRAVAVRV